MPGQLCSSWGAEITSQHHFAARKEIPASSRNWNRAAERSTGPAVLESLLPAARDGWEAELSISHCHRPSPSYEWVPTTPLPSQACNPQSSFGHESFSGRGAFYRKGHQVSSEQGNSFLQRYKRCRAQDPLPQHRPPAVAAQGSRCARCSHGGSAGLPGAACSRTAILQLQAGTGGSLRGTTCSPGLPAGSAHSAGRCCALGPGQRTRGSTGGTGGRRMGSPCCGR